jgi:pyruvate/2-oxoglutarate dehydrogenase complex dihydrolipoamide acyltransferase (E2) component
VAERVIVTVPHETVNDETVRILLWKLPSGSHVEKDQHICDVETSKTVVEMHAPIAGLLEYSVAVGSELPVGSQIFQVAPEADRHVEAQPSIASIASIASSHSTSDEAEQIVPTAKTGTEMREARLTPSARRAANEHGIDPRSFPAGTLVRKIDVLRRAGKLSPSFTSAPDQSVAKKVLGNDDAQVDNAPLPYCVLCQRDAVTLQKLNAVLIKAEIPAGFVCSICLAAHA